MGCAVGIGVVGSKVGWVSVDVVGVSVGFTGRVIDKEAVDSHTPSWLCSGTLPVSGAFANQSSSH